MGTNRQQRCLAALIFAAFSIGASAQVPTRTTSADAELLLAGGDQTVVTASRRVQKIRDVPSAVTVISEDEIRASGAITITDLLRYVPGLDVFEANKGVANVSIRDFNAQFANHLLVMVDGRSIYQDFYGGVYWNTLPLLLSRVKRIEVVRGPGSVLYGANAYDGVINIITKTPLEMEAAAAKTSVRAVVGAQNSQFLEAQTTAGKPKDFAISIGAAYDHTDGLGGRRPGNVRDSYTTPVVTLDAQKQFRRGNLLFSAGNSEATADYAQQLFFQDASWHTSFADLSYNEDKSKTPFLLRGYLDTIDITNAGQPVESLQILNFEAQQQRRLSSRQFLVYGANYRAVNAKAQVARPGTHDLDQVSFYVQDDIQLASRTRLFAGLRVDQHSTYGTNVSDRLSLIHHLPAQQTLRLSYGTAYRAPSIAEQFADLSIVLVPNLQTQILGNENLRPEGITSYEGGYRKDLKSGHIALNVFYNQTSRRIGSRVTETFPAPYPAGIPSKIQYFNGKGVGVYGYELESEFRISARVKGLFNYAFEDFTDNAAFNADLAPKHKVNFRLQAQLGPRWDGFLGAHINGPTAYHDPSSRIAFPVPAYLRVDARLGYRFGPSQRSWTASVEADNLLGDRHQEFPVADNANGLPSAARQHRIVYFLLEGRL